MWQNVVAEAEKRQKLRTISEGSGEETNPEDDIDLAPAQNEIHSEVDYQLNKSMSHLSMRDLSAVQFKGKLIFFILNSFFSKIKFYKRIKSHKLKNNKFMFLCMF